MFRPNAQEGSWAQFGLCGPMPADVGLMAFDILTSTHFRTVGVIYFWHPFSWNSLAWAWVSISLPLFGKNQRVIFGEKQGFLCIRMKILLFSKLDILAFAMTWSKHTALILFMVEGRCECPIHTRPSGQRWPMALCTLYRVSMYMCLIECIFCVHVFDKCVFYVHDCVS